MGIRLKPYHEYKDSGLSWLGKIPAHWDTCRLKYLLREVNVRSSNGAERLLSVSQYTGITPRHSREGQDEPKTRAETLAGYKQVLPNDLVVNIMLAWNGSLGISQFDGIVSPAYCVYQFRGILEPRYCHYLLRSPIYKGRIKTASTGVVESRLRLYSDTLFRIEALIPSKQEQTTIASFVEVLNRKVDRLIRTKRRLIESLNEQKASIINRAVMWGLDQDVPMKMSGIKWLGEIPAHWEMKRLKYIAKLQTGLTLGKNYTVEQMVNRPYLRVANVQDGYLNLSEITTISIPESQVSRYELQPGDVLMTEGGDFDKLGRGFIWEGQIEGCLHQNHVFAVRTHRRNLIPRFLALLMSSSHGKTYFTTTSKQTTNLASTNSTTIKNFLLPLPPIEEQRLIIRFVEGESSKIDSAILKAEREIDLIREYRMCLISEVVTGKFDVRGVKLTELEQVDNVALLDEETIDEACEDAHELEMTEEGINADD